MPRSFVPGIVWPALSRAADAPVLALAAQFRGTEWLAPEILLRRQMQQLTQLVNFAAKTVPFYRQRLHGVGNRRDPMTVAEWRRIPILSREDIRSAGKAMETRRPMKEHGSRFSISTSGSTGQPVTVQGNAVTRNMFTALTLRDHLWRQRHFGGKFVALRRLSERDAAAAASGGEGRWVPGYRSGPMLMRDVDGTIDDAWAWLTAENPDYVLTYPTYLRALIQRGRETGRTLPNLREVLTFGEVVDDELRDNCRRFWGVPLVDTYSTQEVGVIALQCPEHEYYLVQAEAVYLEILKDDGAPCAPGETGRVVVTPLHNFATPLIRYELGDYAEAGETCASGRGLPVITRIHGRARNMLKLPAGGRVWPAFNNSGIADIAPIRQFQVVQTSLTEIVMRLVVSRELNPDEEVLLRRALASAAKFEFDIRVDYVEEIPRSAGGKLEDVICEVAD